MRLAPSSPLSRLVAVRILGAVTVACLTVFPASLRAQSKIQPPDSLTDAEFWGFFKKMSEPDGYFLSENFVSNEVTFQDVIPTLQRTLTKNGVYLGVGPEQNFTYIANLQPRMAVIFDIRRQNAMQHLMYKALFEMSATRAEFVARLFSRPAVARQSGGIAVKALFDSAAAAPSSDSAYKANFAAIIEMLTVKHGFELPKDDITSIEHVFQVFFTAGPEVNYGYRSGNPAFIRSTYPSYGFLQTATNADSVQMAFLASEDNYNAVRRLQLRNLVVPVVADFGGPSGVRAVGQWLSNRSMTVTAFYVSNVEQYLFREPGVAERFYGNVTALPLDATSMFIRSVPRMGMPMTTFSSSSPVSQTTTLTVTRDVNGYLITQSTVDSGGVRVTKTTIDSSLVRRDSLAQDTLLISTLRAMQARVDSIARLSSSWQPGPVISNQVFMMGGTLTSGIAGMQQTLKAHFAGELKNGYNAIIAMTKVSDWKQQQD